MSEKLLEQLPQIVAEGKREAERILERLESRYRIGLQTRELVIPSRDTNAQDMLLTAEAGRARLNPAAINRLIYGDNLLAMAALLAGDDQTPSMRGKVDLIYIDPPFDEQGGLPHESYFPGGDIEQRPTAIEQFAYSRYMAGWNGVLFRNACSSPIYNERTTFYLGGIYVYPYWKDCVTLY